METDQKECMELAPWQMELLLNMTPEQIQLAARCGKTQTNLAVWLAAFQTEPVSR